MTGDGKRARAVCRLLVYRVMVRRHDSQCTPGAHQLHPRQKREHQNGTTGYLFQHRWTGAVIEAHILMGIPDLHRAFGRLAYMQMSVNSEKAAVAR